MLVVHANLGFIYHLVQALVHNVLLDAVFVKILQMDLYAVPARTVLNTRYKMALVHLNLVMLANILI
jgi:hypothetical protein